MTTKKTTTATTHGTSPLLQQQRQANVLRIFIFVIAVLLLAAGIGQELYPFNYLLMVAILLAYPLIAQAIDLYQNRHGLSAFQANKVLTQTDALMIGAGMAALHFDLIPSLVLLIIVHSSTLAYGGLKSWLLNIFLTFVGAAIGFFIFTGEIIAPGHTTVATQVLSLLGLGGFVVASSFFAHQQSQSLRSTYKQMEEQQKQAVNLSHKLAKYVPPQIWGSLFSGKRDAKLETRRKRLTVFFSDIKDFSRISEELPLETLTAMLNSYLNEMTHIAEQHGGTVDKFIGDAVMVFFGDPSSQGAKEDAYQCVAMAVAMQRRMHLLRQRWLRQGIRQKMAIRIGINTGYVTVGNFGTETRMDYTILGTDVNLASRLESAARPGHILISDNTWELVKDRVRARNIGNISVKGFERPIPVHEVVELNHEAGSRKSTYTATTRGFSLYLELPQIRNYDRNDIINALIDAKKVVNQPDAKSIHEDKHGFGLTLQPGQIQRDQITPIKTLLDKAITALQKHR